MGVLDTGAACHCRQQCLWAGLLESENIGKRHATEHKLLDVHLVLCTGRDEEHRDRCAQKCALEPIRQPARFTLSMPAVPLSRVHIPVRIFHTGIQMRSSAHLPSSIHRIQALVLDAAPSGASYNEHVSEYITTGSVTLGIAVEHRLGLPPSAQCMWVI